MLHFDFDCLQGIGLTPEIAGRARDGAAGAATPLHLERVVSVHRETVQLHDGSASHAARPSPRLVRALLDEDTSLAVGDWVLSSIDGHGERWVQARVPPSSHLVRRDGDGSRHAVVSNVDRALVVMGLDDDFNLRRLERYLTLVHAGGIAPLVVLTKADLLAARPDDRDRHVASLRQRLPAGVEVVVVDATDPSSAARFAHVTGRGRTLVLLGSSGAGKSTLTNTLLGAAVQDTGAVRRSDGRGMHTTTARSLHLLPGGACIIDTPGLRTLRPDVDEAALVASFSDVESLSSRCRFRDCSHGDEPGCAVRDGVDPDRLRNFQKLLRETRRDTMTWVERRQQLSAWKSRGKAARERMRLKRGEGS
ncbi:MAG TPA: ribosome small subunit-dependent GTPase A [Caldimonas sp.]|jgi:ribosome biogenesis GTPase|nr:ribosome small subunit-dependent GTPase A [Caldimonas sp.]HEX2541883.1 ribosome small subunit-dependent GTPase A [Caldimonas sp.]